MYACYKNDKMVVEVLLEHNADVAMVNLEGSTAGDLVKEKSIMQLLTESVNATTYVLK